MKRPLRRIGIVLGALAGLVMLASIGLWILVYTSTLPHDHRTTWLEGPGDARIRGVSWIEGGSWIDDPYDVHEYTLVLSDGSETLIGRGDEALDSKQVRLYEHGEQAELVVYDSAFRRTASGRWTQFRAIAPVFILRHYEPRSELAVHRTTGRWRFAFTGVSCWISSVDLAIHRMVSTCLPDSRLRLVFTRASAEAPWSLDHRATFAESPPPERAPFPGGVHATLTAVRGKPSKRLRKLSEANDRLESTLEEPGTEIAEQVQLVLPESGPVDVSIMLGQLQKEWSIEGFWVSESDWPVVLWERRELKAQPWDEAALMNQSIVGGEGASYLVYLELHRPEGRSRDPLHNAYAPLIETR